MPALVKVGDEWFTPSAVMQLVRSVLRDGEIDLDPASCALAQKTVKARVYFSIENSGLSQPWFGRVFLNPPYSATLITKFVPKAITEWDSGHVIEMILLVNNQVDTKWYQSLLIKAQARCFWRGRIAFESPLRIGASANRVGQTFFYFGDSLGVQRFVSAFLDYGVTEITPAH